MFIIWFRQMLNKLFDQKNVAIEQKFKE